MSFFCWIHRKTTTLECVLFFFPHLFGKSGNPNPNPSIDICGGKYWQARGQVPVQTQAQAQSNKKRKGNLPLGCHLNLMGHPRIINMDCCWPLTLKENIKLNDVVQLLYIMYSALYCSSTTQYSPAGSDFGATLIEIFGVPLFSLSANENGKTLT